VITSFASRRALHRGRSITIAVLILFVLLANSFVQGQSRRRPPRKPTKPPEKVEPEKKDPENTPPTPLTEPAKETELPEETDATSDTIRLRLLLDTLTDEAKWLPAASRSNAMADLADAFCKLDRRRATDVFKLAIESAQHDGESQRAVRLFSRRIISSASTCDATAGRLLTDWYVKDLIANGKLKDNWGDRSHILLSNDPDPSPDLSPEAMSRAYQSGQDITTWFSNYIYFLATIDLGAADGTYRSELQKFAAYPDLRLYQLDQLLWFGGYAFGNGDSFGFPLFGARQTTLGGTVYVVPDLEPDPVLASNYLDIAYNGVQIYLQQLPFVVGPERVRRAEVTLFATQYLFDEVMRYRPDMEESWQRAYRQALTMTTLDQQQVVSGWLKFVEAQRQRAASQNPKTRTDTSSSKTTDLDSVLEQAQRMTAGCNRDKAYANIALTRLTEEQLPKILDMLVNIRDPKLQEFVRQIVYYRISKSRIDEGNFIDARDSIEHVTSEEERALLYIMLARRYLNDKDQVSSSYSLNEARRLAEGKWDSSAKTVVYLSASTLYAEYDSIEMGSTLRDAVKTINQVHAKDASNFSFLPQIDLRCVNSNRAGPFGVMDLEAKLNLYDTAATLATSNFDTALLIVRDLEDPATRIRTIASMVKSVASQPVAATPTRKSVGTPGQIKN